MFVRWLSAYLARGSPGPQHYISVARWHTYNPSTQGAAEQVQGHPRLHSAFETSLGYMSL